MSFHSYLLKAKKIILNPIIITRTIYLILFLSIIFLIVKIFYFFEYKKDRLVFLDLFELLERSNGAIESRGNVPLEELNKDIDDIYLKNNNSVLSPYIKSIKGSNFSFMHKNDDAIIEMRESLKNIKLNSETYFLHKLSLGFMLLNSNKESEIIEGKNIIELLIEEQSNPLHEVAIFYYGLYNLQFKSLKEANRIWKSILYDPKYRNSIYKNYIKKAKNWDY